MRIATISPYRRYSPGSDHYSDADSQYHAAEHRRQQRILRRVGNILKIFQEYGKHDDRISIFDDKTFPQLNQSYYKKWIFSTTIKTLSGRSVRKLMIIPIPLRPPSRILKGIRKFSSAAAARIDPAVRPISEITQSLLVLSFYTPLCSPAFLLHFCRENTIRDTMPRSPSLCSREIRWPARKFRVSQQYESRCRQTDPPLYGASADCPGAWKGCCPVSEI